MSTCTVTEKSTIDAVALGRFDGAHRGHQALFDALGPHGAVIVIDTGAANLTPGAHLAHHLSHPCFVYPLPAVKDLDGPGFVAFLKRDFPRLNTIVVGYDFRFGKDRGWSAHDLAALFDGTVKIVEQVFVDGMAVHARLIRTLVIGGEIARANELLGREYEICGEVIPGQGIGRHQFVPTLNLAVEKFLLPAEGVYVTRTLIGKRWRPSVSFIGHRVTTDGNFAVETHVVDGEVAAESSTCIRFVSRLRGNLFFDKFDDLARQISRDIARARQTHGLPENADLLS